MSTTAPHVERSELNGIPCFWGMGPGPWGIGMVARVGIVDETLPRRGVTHLLEHSAVQSRRFQASIRMPLSTT